METCNLCGGELCELGMMGSIFLAVRCRDCGMDFFVEDPELEETE